MWRFVEACWVIQQLTLCPAQGMVNLLQHASGQRVAEYLRYVNVRFDGGQYLLPYAAVAKQGSFPDAGCGLL
jgi:hypothetical protein